MLLLDPVIKPKERPILFQGAMVRALLAGTKTQTRRVVKPRREGGVIAGPAPAGAIEAFGGSARHIASRMEVVPCPYGQPGDRLWVRETARCVGQGTDFIAKQVRLDVDYKAGGGVSRTFPQDEAPRSFPRFSMTVDGAPRWQPAIHMPRWACRLVLGVMEVRIERLQDISRGDAMAEGCPFPNMADGPDPRQWYAELWDSINGATHPWSTNPWVWVIGFRRAAGEAS